MLPASPATSSLVTTSITLLFSKWRNKDVRGVRCEVWGVRWWEIMNYWQGQLTLSFSDVTGSLSSSISGEGLVFKKIHKLMRWSIFNLPTQIHFMSSILTSCLKYSTVTGTESTVFCSYIPPGAELVFKTCQFCFHEEIISIWRVECWLFRFPRRN